MLPFKSYSMKQQIYFRNHNFVINLIIRSKVKTLFLFVFLLTKNLILKTRKVKKSVNYKLYAIQRDILSIIKLPTFLFCTKRIFTLQWE